MTCGYACTVHRHGHTVRPWRGSCQKKAVLQDYGLEQKDFGSHQRGAELSPALTAASYAFLSKVPRFTYSGPRGPDLT